MTAGLPAPPRPSAAEASARIAAMPIVAEARRAHEIALAQPMVGCPWAGEPSVDRAPGPDGLLPMPAWFDWEVGAYAAALLRKRDPAFAGADLSRLRTRFEPPATVLFVADVRCRRSRRHPEGRRPLVVAEVVLPAHARDLPVPAPPAPPVRPIPRGAPRLAPPLPRIPRPTTLENTPMITTDNPPSRKRSAAARVLGGRT